MVGQENYEALRVLAASTDQKRFPRRYTSTATGITSEQCSQAIDGSLVFFRIFLFILQITRNFVFRSININVFYFFVVLNLQSIFTTRKPRKAIVRLRSQAHSKSG